MSASETRAPASPDLTRAADATPRLSFRRAINSEFIKLVTLSSSYWSLLIGVAGMVILGVAVASGAVESSSPDYDVRIAQSNQHSSLTVGIPFAQIPVAIISILLVSSEFTSGSIRVTLASVPSRLPVLFAKCVAGLSYAAVFGVLGLLATFAVTAPLFASKGYELTYLEPSVFYPILNSVIYLMMIAVMNVALATIMRSTVVGIVVMIALMQAVPIALTVAAQSFRAVWIANIGALFPTNSAGAAFFGQPESGVPWQQFWPTGALHLSPWQGVAVMLSWTALFLIAAIISFKRRDI